MSELETPAAASIQADVTRAIEEDIGAGDLTAALLPDHPAQARIICREPGVMAGRPWVDACFQQLDPNIEIRWQADDGDSLQAEQLLCTLAGPARALVSGERTALNFLQTLSGTATITRQYVDAIAGTNTRILDTRKTLPGLRLAQKYAVRCGGGHNHRIGLFDAVLIKENHIATCGSISAAVSEARSCGAGQWIEVEVESLDELKEALAAGAERVLLDNFSTDQLRDAVTLNQGRARLEASGGVEISALRTIAQTGVDDISVGALTKHVKALDLSMRFES